MKERKRRVSDTELEVLKVLWREGHATIREISDELYPSGGVSAHATVQKLLDRLREKQCVGRKRSGRSHTYAPIVDRAELIDVHLEDAAMRLCEGSFAPLLTQLVSSRKLSRDDLEQLRSLVEEMDDSSSQEEL